MSECLNPPSGSACGTLHPSFFFPFGGISFLFFSSVFCFFLRFSPPTPEGFGDRFADQIQPSEFFSGPWRAVVFVRSHSPFLSPLSSLAEPAPFMALTPLPRLVIYPAERSLPTPPHFPLLSQIGAAPTSLEFFWRVVCMLFFFFCAPLFVQIFFPPGESVVFGFLSWHLVMVFFPLGGSLKVFHSCVCLVLMGLCIFFFQARSLFQPLLPARTLLNLFPRSRTITAEDFPIEMLPGQGISGPPRSFFFI